MKPKAIATYAAVFGAGALAVLGVSALTNGGIGPGNPMATQSAPANTPTEVTTPSSEPSTPDPEAVNEVPADTVGAPATSTGDLTAIGNLQRNTFVTVQGTVERVTDEDEFLIADTTGSVRVWTANSFFTVEPGERVSVTGFVDDDVLIEIYAQEITRADGTVVSISSYSQ